MGDHAHMQFGLVYSYSVGAWSFEWFLLSLTFRAFSVFRLGDEG